MKWAWLVSLGALCACAYEPIRLVDAGERDGAMEGGAADVVSPDGGRDGAPSDGGEDARDGDARDEDASEGGALDGDAPDGAPSDGGEDAWVDDAGSDADAAVNDGGMLLRVEPMFASAPRWNDHVVDDLPYDMVSGARIDRDAPACTADKLPVGPGACAHGGVLRQLVLPDETECDGLVLTDARDWFYWECAERDGHVVFDGEGLRPDIDLRDFLDLSEPAQPRWQTNQITVRRGTDIVAQTATHAFWDNPLFAIDDEAPVGGHSLDVDGAVYVVTADLNARLRVLADHVTVTTLDGQPIRGNAFSSLPLIEAQGRAFFRLEGVTIDPNGYTTGLDLDVNFSTVAHVYMPRSGPGLGMGVDARIRAHGSTLVDIKSEHATADGIEIAGGANWVSWVRAYEAGARGVVLLAKDTVYEGVEAHQSAGTGAYLAMEKSYVRDLLVSRSGGDGVRMEGSRYCRLTRVTVTHSAQAGVIVTGTSLAPDDTELNALRDVMSTNNHGFGIALRGRNQVLSVAISASNDTGIDVSGSAHVIQHATVANNAEAGVSQAAAEDTQLINVVAINNKYGVHLHSNASGSLLHDIVAAHNATDLFVEGEGSVFSGVLMLATDAGCDVANGLAQPGLVEGPPCTTTGASTATISAPHSLGSALVGMVSSGDTINAHYAELQQPQGSILSSQITDWLTFSVRQRHWGKYVTAPFPGAGFAGDCRDSVDRCVVWDWRVAGASELKDVFGSVLVTSALDEPVHQRVHRWSASGATACLMIPGTQWDGARCETTFLAYAFEDDDDGTSGNGNILCEAMEGCVLNRHRGGFPGQGVLEPVYFNVPGFGELYLRRHEASGP